MSGIAGVAGAVLGLTNAAHSGRSIIALDGCMRARAKACLDLVRRMDIKDRRRALLSLTPMAAKALAALSAAIVRSCGGSHRY